MESIREILDEDVEIVAPHTLELIERAQIDQQISTAKKYPRDLARVKKRMLEFATLDEETAEACFYTLPRGGKSIQGPSVRLAEIAMSCYGNLRVASRVIDTDETTITAQGVCHDLETNLCVSVESKRRITDSKGKRYNDDMQIVTGNAAGSIALRNVIFRVIPLALIKPVYQAAMQVAVGDASTLATKRAKMITRLNQMQVTTDRILAKLEKTSIENIGLDDLATLVGLGTAIKDGETTVDQAFPPVEGTVGDQKKSANETLDRLRKQQAPKESSTQPNATDATKAEGTTTAPAQSDAATGEPAASQTGNGQPSAPETAAQADGPPRYIVDLRAWRETLGGEEFVGVIKPFGKLALNEITAEEFPDIEKALLARAVVLDKQKVNQGSPETATSKPAADGKLRFGGKKP